ncbi:MAG: copper-translocating P-type ATPase [Dehalococcoidia bacterium]
MNEHEHHSHDMTQHEMHAGHKPAEHDHRSHHAHMVADFRQRFWISLALTVPLLLLSPMIQEWLGIEDAIAFTGDAYVLWGLATIVFFYGGWPFLKGLRDELKVKSPGMMTLIALAITVAYVYSSAVVFGVAGKSFFWELATLIDVMLLGHWLEMKSVMGASSALEELAKLLPAEVHHLMPDGSMHDMPIEMLKVGHTVVVKPGEKIPADGRVTEGESSVNEALLTGESTPVAKQAGSVVIGGSVNGEGSLTVEVQKTGEASYLAQMTSLVRQAQQSQSRSQTVADRAALWLTIIAISAGALTIILWLTLSSQGLAFSVERMVTVMVITCPHALGLAVPLVVAVSTAISARNGLLIRNRNNFERARKIQAILFDKTGTLTKGEFGVTDIVSFDKGMTKEELLKYAASVETRSSHPIARGIVKSVKDTFAVKDFKAIAGQGTEGKVNGKEVKVVSPGYLKENKINIDSEGTRKLTGQGKTVVFVIIDGKLKGAIALGDIIRPESKEAIRRLKEMGIKCLMITGDNKEVAKWVAEEIGLDEYFAEVLPDQKVAKVKEVQARGMIVAMTGDGVNDAPALAQADVGIAIGAGTEVTVATADIILVRSNPLDAVSIIGLSRATYKKMLQNLGWATGYNVLAIPLAAGALYSLGVVLSPAVGAALMSLSTIIVAINARFIRVEKQ